MRVEQVKAKKIIDGKEWKLTLGGNLNGTKSKAEKIAKKMRKMGYNARVIKTKTRYDIYYREKR